MSSQAQSPHVSFHGYQIKEIIDKCVERTPKYNIFRCKRQLQPLFKHYYIKHGITVQAMIANMVPLAATICGPKTSMKVLKKSFKVKLNNFTMILGNPSSGKSRAYEAIIVPVLEAILAKYDTSLEIEDYTKEGLEQHLIDNNGYGLLATDEGATILASINSKTQEGKAEQNYVCRWWGGRASSKRLVQNSRITPPTSLGMLLPVQPECYAAELRRMGNNNQQYACSA